jgi:hypothetical protein
VGHEHVEFLETALVEQQFDPFARGQLALGMLRLDPRAPPPARARRVSSSLRMSFIRPSRFRATIATGGAR